MYSVLQSHIHTMSHMRTREHFYCSGALRAVDIVYLDHEPLFLADQLCDIMQMTESEKYSSGLNETHVALVNDKLMLNQLGAYELLISCKRPIATELRDWLGQIMYRVWREYQLQLRTEPVRKRVLDLLKDPNSIFTVDK